MAVNGRKKGAEFERAVAKKFAAWANDTVKRTPQSGGWSKGDDYGVSGDLVFKEVRTLHVECKHHKDWDLADLLIGVNKDFVHAWWKQARRECPEGRVPLLVFAKNRFPPLVAFPERELDPVRPLAFRRKTLAKLGPTFRLANVVGEPLAVKTLDSFFETFELVRRG